MDNNYVTVSGGMTTLSVGKLTNINGFDRFIRIYKKLLDNGINNRLYVLGEGEKRARFSLNLTDKIRNI